MADKSLARETSAVVASAHAACARFRGTDPLVVGRTRRQLAAEVGFPDESGRVPLARWMRAMTFERLVREDRFAAEIATTAVGGLGLDRPGGIVTSDAHEDGGRTAGLLAEAHDRAVSEGSVTLIHGAAIPFADFAERDAAEVRPDFVVVAARTDRDGASWLILGGAKDYERVRSRIEDSRLLKGFLQVALGAESAASWSQVPTGMSVHSCGVLAVPRNAFLQPTALVESLDDHRAEVRMRVAERRREVEQLPLVEPQDLANHVAHLRATFDPATCTTCTLFSYCRNELRTSTEPTDLLVELGIPSETRPHVIGLVDGTGPLGRAPASVVANVTATLEGVGQSTGQRRIDQAGRPGTVNVVLAKSDSAALGVHGIAAQRITPEGCESWRTTVFDDPQSARCRREVMRLLGRELSAAMAEVRAADAAGAAEVADSSEADSPVPVHLVVPDQPTADVLVSIADNLAGVELSRLRWERDEHMGRAPLTFDGEPAEIPSPLQETERIAVSFLLEADRARALTLRSPIVDLGEALARHVVAGGPQVASHRLDYLLAWAESTTDGPVEPRELEDEIEAALHTPGARLTSRSSDAIHEALTAPGDQRSEAGAHHGETSGYAALVTAELDYKRGIVERALDVLEAVPDSRVREVHREIEGDAQAVWRRRLALRASDLVRFGRTHRYWRNALVPVIESDDKCRKQLLALTNPQTAEDLAVDAGVREVAVATVAGTSPLVLDVDSRRIGGGSRIVLLRVNGEMCVERPEVGLTVQKGSFKFAGLSIGALTSTGELATSRRFEWEPENVPDLSVGDRLVVADFAWFAANKNNRFLNLTRPRVDDVSAPKPTCEPSSYSEAPENHERCCRPHEDAEAERADRIAERRARGELNPEVWPPVADSDGFEVAPADAPVADVTAEPVTSPPDDVTMDDLE
ncbi:hypothetical protein [Actinopolyspora saharensis]|uniref:Uncharacterized protein n=1 Tax=Actinopolyspora saharensis TaxID=995062 RepID=A0A1H1F299_9ACTN|nr:hypothetical protein [Actinopolyspora saharensis]SDQ94899.1 hypothetical protein SAMN04489718_2792 [Actinopolyspora saharensis]